MCDVLCHNEGGGGGKAKGGLDASRLFPWASHGRLQGTYSLGSRSSKCMIYQADDALGMDETLHRARNSENMSQASSNLHRHSEVVSWASSIARRYSEKHRNYSYLLAVCKILHVLSYRIRLILSVNNEIIIAFWVSFLCLCSSNLWSCSARNRIVLLFQSCVVFHIFFEKISINISQSSRQKMFLRFQKTLN